MNDHWDRKFMDLARTVAGWSKDPSTKVGCVIVGPAREVRSMGYNGIPRGVRDTSDRMQRPVKYDWFCHAEENAVANAARVGQSLDGCTAYTTLHPCNVCARMLIQAGVARIVTPLAEIPARWAEQFTIAKVMLVEANVLLTEGQF